MWSELDHNGGGWTEGKSGAFTNEALADQLKQALVRPEHEVLRVLGAGGALEARLASVLLIEGDLSGLSLELLEPLQRLVLQVSPQELSGESLQVLFDLPVLLGLDLSASLAREEGILHTILELDALRVGPGDVITETLPVRLEASLDGVCECGFLNQFLHLIINLGLDGLSCLLPLRAIVVVEGEHVVVGPAVHLNWEDGRLEGECSESQLFDPWLEVEAVDGWHGIVLLARLDLVVVLAWRVQT